MITNEAVLQHCDDIKQKSLNEHFVSMRKKHPKLASWTNDEIAELYDDNNSHSQSRRCRGGGELERFLESSFRCKNISFARQVPVNNDGIIVKTKKGMKIIDIVFGIPKVGDHISNFKIMSIKKSSRERYTEDDWTLVQKPKLYLYTTLDADYPQPEKFKENDDRKLICAKPKPEDSRQFKLGFENIIDLVRE